MYGNHEGITEYNNFLCVNLLSRKSSKVAVCRAVGAYSYTLYMLLYFVHVSFAKELDTSADWCCRSMKFYSIVLFVTLLSLYIEIGERGMEGLLPEGLLHIKIMLLYCS